ncbi:MAG TPA: PAS domain S-box protein [Dongiaceae bacterium]|nr:PAS domain S-box protein [Dongiaceae bacterium]
MTDTLRPHLHEKPSRFAALMDAAVDAIIVIDHRGQIQEFNPAAERLFGYPAQDVLQKNVSLLMPQPYAGEHDQYLAHYNATGEARIIGIGREALARRQDGSEFPIDLSVGEVKEGNARFFVGIIRDVSERKEVQELHRRLAHVTRLSTLGEMASGIAHEINQPLTAIATYAQAARRLQEKGATAELDSVLDKIAKQAERAAAVIRQMRSFVSRQDREQALAHPAELVASVVQFLQTDTGRRNIEILQELPDKLPTLMIDTVQIQQVLLNLLLNAMDATEAAGSHEPVRIRARIEGEAQVLFEVLDRGCGVQEQHRDQLFTPFFTTKAAGMGMGLPICRSIVQAHGGQLTFQPHPAGGSIFQFTLPALVENGVRGLSEQS